MKKTITLIIFIVLTALSYSQILTIRDKESNQALEMVTIYSESPRASALTNAHGQVDLSEFKGSEKIEIRMIGYSSLTYSYSEIEKSEFKINIEPSSLSLEQYTVVASKWNQSTRDIPAKITSISVQEIALKNPQTTADLLATSGEVFIQKSQQGGGSPMIRGFATNRLLITVDGVRMNTAIFRSGNVQNVISLDPFAVERTEVLFGPGSVIYGSDAIGGVMGFNTLTPKLSLEKKSVISGNALTRYSSANNERTGHFDINIGWKKFAMVSSFSYFNFDDLRMGTKGPDEYLRNNYVQRIGTVDMVMANDDPLVQRPSGYEQINMMQKLRFRPNNHWDINYGFHYSTTTNYSRYDQLLRIKKGKPRFAEWYYGPQEWMMNNLSVTNSMNSGIYDQLTVRLTHQFFEESRHERDMNVNGLITNVEQVDVLAANFDFSKAISAQHSLMYGLEYVYNEVNSTGNEEDISTGVVIDAPARYPMSTWSSSAAYLTYLYRPSEKFTLQTGARYNIFDLESEFDTTFYPFTDMEINDGSITGSVGAIYKPDQKWTLNANLSTGFRAPNVDDAGKLFSPTDGHVVVPNSDLTSEYAYNAEIDIAKVFGDFLRIDVAVFYTYLDNAMVLRDFTFNGKDSLEYHGDTLKVQAVQNAAFAEVYGIQAGIEIKLPQGFGISSKINYHKGEEEMDDGTKSPLRHAAPFFGISSLTYTAQKLKLDLYAAYSSKVTYDNLAQTEQGKPWMYAIDVNGNPWSPGWYTLNFKAMYQLNELFSISAGLENITDQRYRPYSSGLVAPGRNFIFSLKASF